MQNPPMMSYHSGSMTTDSLMMTSPLTVHIPDDDADSSMSGSPGSRQGGSPGKRHREDGESRLSRRQKRARQLSPVAQEDLRLRINHRERERMHDMNSALDALRQVMPYAHGPSVKKLSKMATMLLARNYIVVLRRTHDELRRMLCEVQSGTVVPGHHQLLAAAAAGAGSHVPAAMMAHTNPRSHLLQPDVRSMAPIVPRTIPIQPELLDYASPGTMHGDMAPRHMPAAALPVPRYTKPVSSPEINSTTKSSSPTPSVLRARDQPSGSGQCASGGHPGKTPACHCVECLLKPSPVRHHSAGVTV